MALITCPECNMKLSDKALSCPHCGFPIQRSEKPVKKSVRKPRRYPKLPNGFGSIKKLSGNRTNPYAVHPATESFSLKGSPETPPAIAYVKDWYTAFGVLSAYNAGTYTPGQEIEFDINQITDEFVLSIISAYNYGASRRKAESQMTFEEIYQEYEDWDLNIPIEQTEDEDKKRKLKQRRSSMRTAFKQSKSIHKFIFSNLRHKDLQKVIDECEKKHATKELIIVLFHKMYKYADINDIQKENHSKYLTINSDDDDEGGVPFTFDELKIIWENREDDICKMILIMCLSGFRISAYKKGMEINLEEKYFRGGVKTKNGIFRTVPIHHEIYPFVSYLMDKYGEIIPYGLKRFRENMYNRLAELGIEKHTPHDCRDTFATLCDHFGVDKIYLKRLMGHSLSSDITEDKYIKPDPERLRSEIEKVNLLLIVTNGHK